MLSSFRLKFMIYHLSSLDFNFDLELKRFWLKFRFPLVFRQSFQYGIFISLETSWVSFIIHKSQDMGKKYMPHSGEKAWNSPELCGLCTCHIYIGWKIDNCNCLVEGCEKWIYKILIICVAKAMIISAYFTLLISSELPLQKESLFSQNGQSQWP